MANYPPEPPAIQGLSAMANEALILAERMESKTASNRMNLHGSWAEVAEGSKSGTAPTNLEATLHRIVQTLQSAEQHLDYVLNNY